MTGTPINNIPVATEVTGQTHLFGLNEAKNEPLLVTLLVLKNYFQKELGLDNGYQLTQTDKENLTTEISAALNFSEHTLLTDNAIFSFINSNSKSSYQALEQLFGLLAVIPSSTFEGYIYTNGVLTAQQNWDSKIYEDLKEGDTFKIEGVETLTNGGLTYVFWDNSNSKNIIEAAPLNNPHNENKGSYISVPIGASVLVVTHGLSLFKIGTTNKLKQLEAKIQQIALNTDVNNPISQEFITMVEEHVNNEAIHQSGQTELQFDPVTAQKLRESVFSPANPTLFRSPSSFEKGKATEITFNWNINLNEDVKTSFKLDGVDVSDTGNQKVTVTSTTTKTLVLDRDSGSNITRTATSTAYIPQYVGLITTNEPSYNYADLQAHTKRVQNSSNLSFNGNLNNNRVFFLTNVKRTPFDPDTGQVYTPGPLGQTGYFVWEKEVSVKLADGSATDMFLYVLFQNRNQPFKISLK